jgi:hypothetical protein
MKKTYSKPYIAVESFQLDAAIASACSADGKQPLGYSMDTCNLVDEMPGLNYFGNACIHDVKVEGDGNDLICYHGPVPASGMFMNS